MAAECVCRRIKRRSLFRDSLGFHQRASTRSSFSSAAAIFAATRPEGADKDQSSRFRSSAVLPSTVAKDATSLRVSRQIDLSVPSTGCDAPLQLALIWEHLGVLARGSPANGNLLTVRPEVEERQSRSALSPQRRSRALARTQPLSSRFAAACLDALRPAGDAALLRASGRPAVVRLEGSVSRPACQFKQGQPGSFARGKRCVSHVCISSTVPSFSK